jgi:xylulokinase
MIEALLGLDVGTTSTKAVLFDLAGAELARASSHPYRSYTPHPGWVQQDPEELWSAVVTTIKEAVLQVGAGVHVVALGMAAQSGSLLPAGDKGEPVYPFITWMDGRSKELVQQWRDEGIQEQIRPISGWSLYPGLCLPTIAWLSRYDPDLFSLARHYFSVNDFIAYRLTGQYCTNPSNAGGMQLVDIHTGRWSERLTTLAGITPEQLSPIQPTGAVAGKIKSAVCQATGLSRNTLLINGGHDQGCTALGLGVTSPGKLLLACGTAWVVTGVTDSPEVSHIPDSLDLNFHLVPDRWTMSQSLGGLGASLEWWVNQAWRGNAGTRSRHDTYTNLDDEIGQSEPGGDSLYFLPLTGGHDDPATTQRGGFVGLQLSHNRANMARAIMESAAYELRWALTDVQEAGLPVDKLWMVGGATSSSHWPAILANATGIPICLPRYDNWPALGAAVIAGIGAGLFGSIEDGLNRFEKSTFSVDPDETTRQFYDQGFDAYRNQIRNFTR